MKRNIHIGLILLTFSAFFMGCDKVEMPIPKPDEIVIPIDTNNEISFPAIDSANLNRSFKKTYVEEFTGHQCTTCPANTELLLAQLEANKDRMIVTSVHAGDFAKVSEFAGYPTNFNTTYGTSLFLNYTEASTPIPSAMINRRAFENFNNLILFNNATTFWTDPINFENSNTSADFALGVEADYIDSLDLFYIQASAEVLNTVTQNYRLLILCIEDSVVSAQLDSRADPNIYPGKRIPDYTHRHVLRAKLNPNQSIAGEPFITGGAAAGEWFGYQLNVTMPANVVNKENTHIVAVIVDEASTEVMQSEEIHVHVVK